MRVIRIVAILQELIFRRSYHDPYVPPRVMSQVEIV
jgi:poly-beta-1,6-N-acetyl-D-glucosamine synthase